MIVCIKIIIRYLMSLLGAYDIKRYERISKGIRDKLSATTYALNQNYPKAFLLQA